MMHDGMQYNTDGGLVVTETVVLIPAYKPDAKMIELVRGLYEKELHVVIVDDGSGEAYAGQFRTAALYAHVITCAQNRGKGAALKAGLAEILATVQPPYVVVTADADGQHSIGDILRVAKEAERFPEAMVLGCRTISRNMPLRNWFGNFYTRIAFLLASGKLLRDTQTGLRGFSHLSVSLMLSTEGTRYEYETNVLLRWIRANRLLKEVPICTIYQDGNSSSHFRAVSDSAIIYKEILRFAAPQFLCFALDVLLFMLLVARLPAAAGGLWTANAGARLVSGVLHFFLLRRQLRNEPDGAGPSVGRYCTVAAAVLVLDSLLLWVFTALGLPSLGAKLLANTASYFLTFTIQPKLLFSNGINHKK